MSDFRDHPWHASDGANAPTTPRGLVPAHTGLRGLLTGWIVIFHAVIYSLGWNLHGSALMPIFYLLAGYSLAIAYDGDRLKVGRFYRNRFARVAPVYYVTLLIALPLAYAGHSWVPPELISRTLLTNLFAVQMWFGTIPVSFVGPAWTISTLAFFYLIFPWLLRWHQGQDTPILRRWLIALFWAQLVVYFAISIAVDQYDNATAFWTSHAWPISRLPVFDMALIAGLLVRRRAARVVGMSQDTPRKIDRNSAIFAALILIFSVIATLWVDLLASWWMQGVFPYLLLQIIVGLSLVAPQASITQRVLTWPPMLFLGRIGLSLYLIHEIVIYAIAFAARPDQPFYFQAMPVWGIAVMLPVSLILATLLERFVERPARAALRARP